MTAVAEPATQVSVLSAASARLLAEELGHRLALEDLDRDRDRHLPQREFAEIAETGLLAITVPVMYGGPGLPASVVADVIRLLAWGDPNVAQIPHSHFVYLDQLRRNGGPIPKRAVYGAVMAGGAIANAQSEFGTRNVREYTTTLRPDGPGRWRLSGEKFYCTGSLFADHLAVLAHLGEGGPLHVAWVRASTPGVEVIDDWDALGQRTTGSGTVRLSDVPVTDEWITPFAVTFDRPTTYGARAQLLHAAIDAGIARRAIDEAGEFVRTRTRPYPDSGVERAVDDPVVVRAFGEMELAVRGAEALLEQAGRRVDDADRRLDEESIGEASLAVAAARASTAEVAVQVASRLFEVAGTRAALAGLDLDRHWRNARTHTLHDPVGWKVQHLGRWAAARTLPPRHGQL